MPDVSFIVVNWNTRQLLLDCLASLALHARGFRTEVIVVDNGSRDGSVAAVRAAFPDTQLLEAGENLGFARANNRALAVARGRFLALVNSDVVLLPGCLEELMTYMELHPRAGLVGPRVLNPDRSLQPSCRRFPTLPRLLARALFVPGVLEDPAWKKDEPQPVEILAGCFWLARREAVEQVGPLDERFFMYGEDFDWCRRFASAGWQLALVPAARIIHKGGASSAADPCRFALEMRRASYQCWCKHHGPASALAMRGILALHGLVRTPACAAAWLLRPARRASVGPRLRAHLATVGWALHPGAERTGGGGS